VTVKVEGETNCPLELIVHEDPAAIMLLGLLNIDKHGPASAVAKPLPLTVTAVPSAPPLGVSVIVAFGVVTVKVAVAKS
jgi:hypothetical protein